MKEIEMILFWFILNIVNSPNMFAAAESKKEVDLMKVYRVNKKVCDFPEQEDISTPESAYAAVNRVMARGDNGAWQRISIKKLADSLPKPDTKPQEVKPEVSRMWLNAEILEVRIFKNRYAAVISKVTRDPNQIIYDERSFELEDGKWLNAGQSLFESINTAQEKFAQICTGYYMEKPVRPKIEDPDSYIKPFVDFLKKNMEEPKTFVTKALSRNKIVIIGEIHHRPQYWAFNSSLVREPEFEKKVGIIYLELPKNDQHLVDEFLKSTRYDDKPIIEMLRDNLWMGWPDRAMLDFFASVWMVNQNLETGNRLRIVLVDMERPWKQIKQRGDWQKYDVDRDEFMVENILKDMEKHPNEKRNALFIVGVGHTGLNFKYVEGTPLKTAGWYLRDRLGEENVYAIFQHRCVQTNDGRIDGRLCLGLFDSAFAAVGNNPIAFDLKTGPFGEQPYDADPDRPVSSKYKDGFNAYLYLGPLETEIFSPLIAGFYTDEFVKELDRRHHMMFGKGWAESYRKDKMDAETFIDWMSNSWGKPRKWRTELGPKNAWKFGDKWEDYIRTEKYEFALSKPEFIKKLANGFFETIKTADYDYHFDPNSKTWRDFKWTLPNDYKVERYYDAWIEWVCTTLKQNPIKTVELGEVFKDERGLPAISYKVTLKDNTVLENHLCFEYLSRYEYWIAAYGFDWHLKSRNGSIK
jgi:hypothetical protein